MPLLRRLETAVLCVALLVLVAVWGPAACGDDGKQDADTTSPDLFDATGIDAPDQHADTGADALTDGDTLAVDTTPPALTGNWEDLPLTETRAGQDPAGAADVAASLGPGQARAGRVSDDPDDVAVFRGYSGRCRPGDYKLYNAQVAFCVEGPLGAHNILYSGGKVIDAVRVEGGDDQLVFLGPNLDLRETAIDTVEVVDDGTSGDTAVVRAVGTDEQLLFVLGLLGTDLNLFPPSHHTVITEYRLRPDAAVLEMVTWVTSERSPYVRMAGDFLAFEDATLGFVRGAGLRGSVTDADEFLAVGEGTSYLYKTSTSGEVLAFAAEEGAPLFTSFVFAKGRVPKSLMGAYRRLLVVGDGSSSSLDAALARFEGNALVATDVQLTVAEPGTHGGPVAGLRFVAVAEDGTVVATAATDTTGVARFALEPGGYTLQFEPWDGPALTDFAVAVANTPVALEVTTEPAARLAVQLDHRDPSSGDTSAMPGRILVNGPVRRLVLSATGRETLVLPPGDYSVEVSRGLEYDALQTTVQLTGGADPTPLVAALDHALPTPGFVAGEFHQHAAPSTDSTVPVIQRVLENMADGVDFMSPSDHDVLYPFAQLVESMGLRPWILSLDGSEVSPVWGHMNAIGAIPDPARPAFGSPRLALQDDQGAWYAANAADAVRMMREDAGARLVQINHPRGSSGFFDSNQFDPEVGIDVIAESRFPRNFDLLELFNTRSETCEVFRDWYALLNGGYRLIAVGNSDAHGLGGPAGFPRNYVPVVDDRPAALDVEIVTQAVATGNVTIAGGALVRLGEGWNPGDTRSATHGGTVSIPVQVVSPPWSAIDTLVTVVNGHVVDTRTFSTEASALIDFDGVIDVTLSRDSYVLFVAWGSTRPLAVYQGEAPFSITNPIYFDVDGDADGDGAAFEAPGADEPLDAIDYALCTL